MNSFYTTEEMSELGLASFGNNVLISRKASLYGVEKISIGNNVRIDDFCILSGKIQLGNYIHIASYVGLYGGNDGIMVGDFVGISSKATIYSTTDDYSGQAMTNPTVPEKYKKVISKAVIIERHVIIGAGCIALPGVIMGEGGAFGAMSFINRNSEPWSMNAGIPFKKIKDRSKNLLKLEREFLEEVRNE